MYESEFDSWRQAIRSSAEDVLETMFFCPVLGGSELAPGEDSVAATLRFEGDPSGALTLGLSASAARYITGNFIGAGDEGPIPEQLEQVTAELANMMCGNILARQFSGRTFALTRPEPVRLSPPLPGSIAIDLTIEEGVLTTYLTFDRSQTVGPN